MPPNHGKAGHGLPPGAQNLLLTGKTSRALLETLTRSVPPSFGGTQLSRSGRPALQVVSESPLTP